MMTDDRTTKVNYSSIITLSRLTTYSPPKEEITCISSNCMYKIVKHTLKVEKTGKN